MSSKDTREIINHLSKHLIIYLSSFIIITSLIIAFKLPIYFRHDDTRHLELVYDKSHPFIAFNPKVLEFGHYRPMIHLIWWILYHLFGLNPFPYQMVTFLIYGFSFVFFFKFVEKILSKRVASFSLVAYFIIFFWLTYIPFSFAHLTFIMEIFFMNLSMYLLVLAIHGRLNLIWGILCYVSASLTHESAMVIVPVVVSSYLFCFWKNLDYKNQKMGILIVGIMLGVGTIGIIISPLSNESSNIRTITNAIHHIYQRWDFYSMHLVKDFGVLIWIATFYLIIKNLINKMDLKRVFYPLFALSIIISLTLKQFNNLALLILFITFIPLLIKRTGESIAIVWFSVSLLGFMLISFTSRTYLTDASFGISIIVGIALSDITLNIGSQLKELQSKRLKVVLSILSIILFLIGMTGFMYIIQDKVKAAYVVSATRQNFKDVIRFISNNINDNGTIIVLDYTDMGIDYYKDIHPLNDLKKAHRQKTMEIETLGRLFRVMGKENIGIHNLRWFLEDNNVNATLLFTMNSYEAKYVESLNLNKNVIYQVERGDEKAVLYHLIK